MKNKPRFKVGDVLVDGRGWRRQIVRVMHDYLGKKGRFGYFYNTEDWEKMAKYGDGQWNNDWAFNLTSQENLLSKGYKLLEPIF